VSSGRSLFSWVELMKVSLAIANTLQISMQHIAEIQREISFVSYMLQTPSNNYIVRGIGQQFPARGLLGRLDARHLDLPLAPGDRNVPSLTIRLALALLQVIGSGFIVSTVVTSGARQPLFGLD
jgi:hypothetical protein